MALRVIMGLLPIANLWVLKELINNVALLTQTPGSADKVYFYLMLQLALVFSNAASRHLLDIVDMYLESKTDFILQERTIEKFSSVPLAYFDNNKFYDHRNRLSGNLGRQMFSPIKNCFSIIQRVITLVSFLIFLISIHWFFVLFALLTAFPVVYINAKYGRESFYLIMNQTPLQREASYIMHLLNDRISAKEIRLFNLEKYMLEKWKSKYYKNLKETLKLSRKNSTAIAILEMVTGIVYFAAGLFLIRLLQRGSVLVGDFVAVVQAVQGAQSAINNISQSIAMVYKDHLFIKDIFEFLSFEDEKIHYYIGTQAFPPSLEKGISFTNVSFNYPDSNRKALDNVTLHINPGEKVAIVGTNGSGKTTLVKCLMGLYSIGQGDIKFGGESINEIDQKDLRKNITTIFQDFIKYNFTVKENIALSDNKNIMDLEKVIETSKKSGLHNYIMSLPKQYDAVLGKVLGKGEDFSGGQWQKLALTRALFKQGKVFILDEPTASLDPQAELDMYENFNYLTEGKTTIFISHRMASAKMADKIFLLKGGRIIETGTHSELLALKGEYSKMYLMQAKWYNSNESKELMT
ncbi:ABC transporter ATP-binding protein [Virgibacillus sp. DJP39]|uniref:ABC transporter ATP-binding protein n=1 Tax=Virgibacillus sp. DJP39 TaxID=3409790 RepID=UPI003BB60417